MLTREMPYNTEGWTAVYDDVPGWKAPLSSIRDEKDFPPAFSSYISRLENELCVPIRIISVGPDRDETIIRSE